MLGRLLGGLLRAVATLAGVVLILALAVLGVVSRELPAPATRWLERQLARGPVCVRFDRAAFNLRDGVSLRGVRVFVKRRVGPPCLSAGELRIRGRPSRRSPATWVESVLVRDVVVADLPELSPCWVERVAAPAAAAGSGGARGALQGTPNGWLEEPVRVRVEGLTLWGQRVERLSFEVQRDGPRLRLDDLQTVFSTRDWREDLRGWLEWDPDARSLRTQLAGQLTPPPLVPLFARCGANGLVRVLRRFTDFAAPLRVVTDAHCRVTPGKPPQRWPHGFRVRVDGDAVRYRGVPLQRFRAEISGEGDGSEPTRVNVSPLICEHRDGRLACTFTYDPALETYELSGEASLPALPLVTLIDLPAGALPGDLVFDGAPTLSLSGRIAETNSPLFTDVAGHVRSDGVTVRGVRLEQVSTDFAVASNRVSLSGFEAGCHGGAITGAITVAQSVAPSGHVFRIQTAFDGLQFNRLCEQLGRTNSPGGRLEGWLDLSGEVTANRPPRLRGEGHVALREGVIARVPLFAGFTDYLARNVPGIDALVTQSDAQVPFMITNSVLHADRVLVEGSLFSLRGTGFCRLNAPTNQLDFVVQARLFKQKSLAGMMARVVTFPLSKFMEFHVEGPVAQPRWTYIGLIDRLRDLTWGGDDEDVEPDGEGGEAAP